MGSIDHFYRRLRQLSVCGGCAREPQKGSSPHSELHAELGKVGPYLRKYRALERFRMEVLFERVTVIASVSVGVLTSILVDYDDQEL